MKEKTCLYIDKVSLEIIAEDSSLQANYYRNIIEIFRRHADIYLDLTEDEINELQNPTDLNNPGTIFQFIEGKQLKWPKSGVNVFTEVRSRDSNFINTGNAIFILNRKDKECKKLRKNYGVWAISIKEMDDNVFYYSFGKGLNCLSLEKVDSQSQQLCGSTIVRNATSIMMK